MAEVKVEGFVATGFERVRETFAENFRAGREVGASFAVARDGALVVDLWGGFRDRARTQPWARDTLVNVWSTTKGLAALCVALLVERGKLSYEQTVASVWPEFAAGGKQSLTIVQLLSHQGGLSGLREPIAMRDYADHARIARALAAQTPFFAPGQSGYHAITHGFLAGELVRRATGKTLGAFFRDEVARPLDADAWIGLPETEDARAAEMIAPQGGPNMPLPEHPAARAALGNPPLDPEVPNQRWWRAAEIPAANGHANAASLARVYGMLARGGEHGGKRFLSRETLAEATRERVQGTDLVLQVPVQWAAGWMLNGLGIYGENPHTFAHAGWGGSFGAADPDAMLGIGYAMNQMYPNLMGDPRSLTLIAATYASL
ncbi:MAG: serine hydrolase domain-containing protein [Myxococcota bacterium]|jgi:CubicO group peptidase (beta-lactamase class C family)